MNAAACAAYQAALTAIERRRLVRGLGLRTWNFHQEVERRARAAMREMAEIGWTAELTQLAAYASAGVLLVLHAAEAADQDARDCYQAWDALAGQNQHANAQVSAGLLANFADSDATMAAFNAIGPAVVAADQADDALAALIKAHLQV
jgi:hypothetical protein